MAILAILFVLKKTEIPLRIQLPLHKELPKMAIMILNLVIRTIALNVALYFGTSFAAAYGPKYSAAYTILLNIWFFGAFFIDGYSSAGNILSGKLFGEENYDELVRLSVRLTKYALIVGVFMFLIGGILYYPIGILFTKEQIVLDEFYATFWLILAMNIPEGKKIYFSSDNHLGAPTAEASLPREKKFVAWLNKIEHDAAAIFLLGDLFDFWFEYRTVVPKGFVRTLGKLAELRDKGIPIYFFVGNHVLQHLLLSLNF